MSVRFGDEHCEFNFSKIARQRHDKELPNEDIVVERIASIAIPPNDPLQRFMKEHENDMYMQEEMNWRIFSSINLLLSHTIYS